MNGDRFDAYLGNQVHTGVDQEKSWDAQQMSLAHAKIAGHAEVYQVLSDEVKELMDQAFRCRALGQESVGKQKEETAKYLLSLIGSLPTKLRAK